MVDQSAEEKGGLFYRSASPFGLRKSGLSEGSVVKWESDAGGRLEM